MSSSHTGTVNGRDGQLHPIIQQIYREADERLKRSAISEEEGRFLATIIAKRDIHRTLEIGCANGLSSLFICDALSAKPNPHHVIIDPFQSTHWKSRGVAHLKTAGFNFWELIEKKSDEALPALLAKGNRFDFVFIDGCHTFDNTLIDFFYAQRLLNVGGAIVFDDVSMEAVRHVIRYVFNYPNLEMAGFVPYGGWRRKLLRGAKRGLGMTLWPLTSTLGHTSYEFWADGIIRFGRVNAIDGCSMIAFQKTAEDERSCEWHEPF